MHLALAVNLFLPDNGDVIFALAGNHTSLTVHATVQVDGHAPLVAGVRDQRGEQVRLLTAQVRVLAAGDSAELTYVRGGRSETLTVTLGELG